MTERPPPKEDPFQIEWNPAFQRAFEALQSLSKPLLITGRAGTGKSTLLQLFRNHTNKRLAVLAPTGVAALNVQGVTIHSFFRFRSDITEGKVKKIKKKSSRELYTNLDLIIIDEISMVRADLLDCVERFLRLNGRDKHLPFGGIPIAFFGDLYQLPPVVTSEEKRALSTLYASPYFFDAHALQEVDLEIIELDQVYRQSDQSFITLLDRIRKGHTTAADIATLQQRHQPNLDETILFSKGKTIYLSSTNKRAEAINSAQLARLSSELIIVHGQVEGEFKKSSLPTEEILSLKKGAQVMLLNNDSQGRWVNGSLGTITSIDSEDVLVEIENGNVESVSPYTWQLFRYRYDQEIRSLVTETVARFTQYPFRLAWALTIHKAQGKTFDRVILDLSGGIFATGQLYVALSRCRTLEGLFLKQPLKKSHVRVDFRVQHFLTRQAYTTANHFLPLPEKEKLIQKAITTKRPLQITYLKTNDQKTERTIQPIEVGQMSYGGKTFLGLSAYCYLRQEERVFRLDRILEIEEIKEL